MEKNPTYLFVVAAALKDKKGRILVQKRPQGKPMEGLWEFPGGKVEAGEMPELALARELTEELGIVVEPGHLQPVSFASEPLDDRHLLLLLYICEVWTGTVQEFESSEFKWLEPADILELEMPPADLPLVHRLIKLDAP